MPTPTDKSVRYAVVGLGYFAQSAILPAFKHARKNSRLVAFVSEDPLKQKKLGDKYRVGRHSSYEDFDALLKSGEIDAVYIALPNHLHAEFAIKAARAGIHVLCEKPLAVTSGECQRMIQAAANAKVKLMTAYRLHFEPANLYAIDLIKRGKIGEPLFFSSVFSHNVVAGDIRTNRAVGGGGLYDLGVYCINAARYLFRNEPTEVFAFTENNDPRRFKGVDSTSTAILRFPGKRLAQFTISQSSAETSYYRIVGTKGDIVAEPAYDYSVPPALKITIQGKTQERKFLKSDQVAPEIEYFSNCILKNKDPEPSGKEGLADVRIVEALYTSAKLGRPEWLSRGPLLKYPGLSQKMTRPPVSMPELIHAKAPSGS